MSIEFLPHLGPDEVEFRKVVPGQDVVLHSAIVMPPLGKEGELVIEFRRSDLTAAFVHGLFYEPDSEERKRHPFTYPGVEAVLRNDSMIITIHPGVNMHIRGDMESNPDYTTFVSEDVKGKILASHGDIYYSGNKAIIRDKLSEVFSFTNYTKDYLSQVEGLKYQKLDDGSMGWVKAPGVELLPKRYAPRVEVY